ncbi:Tumor necrosis factor alpha-induced protein 8-like protein 3, partial [Ataeniobius toweri]|nr:Tumor necrosis factor alpha-induced protein 8-like protein 3 [Ataeniobius toweri]
ERVEEEEVVGHVPMEPERKAKPLSLPLIIKEVIWILLSGKYFWKITCNFQKLPGQESFNSRSLALQAQKKILSKMATMAVANMLTDDTSSEILDELYKATREFTKSKKEAHKIIKDVIKIALKIGILYRNHQFSPDELDTVERFKKKMNQAAMTAVSFYEVEYTFDRNILAELLLECRDLLHTLVVGHLTARSHARIDHVFNHFANGDFLVELYGDGEEYRISLRKICNGINKLLDEGTL